MAIRGGGGEGEEGRKGWEEVMVVVGDGAFVRWIGVMRREVCVALCGLFVFE
jgi:hypothetical protein